MNIYNTGIIIHSEAQLTVNPGKCKLTPPYRPISQVSNPRKNQSGTWQKEAPLGRTNLLTVPWNSYILHYGVKSMRQSWERRWDWTPPFLSSSGNPSAQCIVKSNSSLSHSLAIVIQVLLSNIRWHVSIPHFQSFAPSWNSHGLSLELLLFLLVLKAIDIASVTTVFCCMVLAGSEQFFHLPSRSSITASQLAAQVVKTRTHVLFGSSHLSVVYIGI